MVAEVELQRVARMTGGRDSGSWMEHRAVCYDHVRQPGDEFIAPWMAKETHENWIDAQLDAIEHNMERHRPPQGGPTFDEILQGVTPEVESLLPGNRLRPHHAR